MTLLPVNKILARQDGVISAGQALAAGLGRDAIERRVARGEWRRVGPGTYLATERPWDDEARLRAAVLGAGAGAAADGPSAAWWHGILKDAPRSITVTIPLKRSIKRGGDIRVRRRDLDWTDVDTVRSLRVTNLPLTVLETVVVVRNGPQLLDRALQQNTSLPILKSVHEKHLGRHGSKTAGAMLLVAAEGGASEAERMLLRLLRADGLSGWRTHVRILRYEVDVAFVAQKLIVEVDGWAWHRDVLRFDHDAERHNALTNAGWSIIRFTYHRIRDEPEAVIAEIRAALRRL
ncbi:hypothetical protein GCM10007304_47480 [Rhodococcoides trifolii]|uniref:DUF559 domain-containing protein n=1 Tax=Rhodococcoides trifolii TaxID=908250 RepID=A0A917G8B9_9NOCA|nr:type IV toxin-antitoxin system AbiEi family antitoxin domain-containing protein [Rhodococcus trifolii]GGG28163.1 hypothetical protein GCM10007304_47480 [Rhodococcus trifolii]